MLLLLLLLLDAGLLHFHTGFMCLQQFELDFAFAFALWCKLKKKKMFREQTSSQKISTLSTNDRWLWCYFVSSFHGATGQTTHFKDYWIDLFSKAAKSTWKESTKKKENETFCDRRNTTFHAFGVYDPIGNGPNERNRRRNLKIRWTCSVSANNRNFETFHLIRCRFDGCCFACGRKKTFFFFRIQNRNSVNVETFCKLTTDHAVHMRLLTEYFYQL